MPLWSEERFGFRLHKMPQLTQTWGPVLEPMAGSPPAVLTREMELLRPFAEHVSKLTFFHQAFHPSLQNWLPFYWKGFTQTTRFTYVLDDISDADRLLAGMTHQARSQIKKASRPGLTIQPANADDLWTYASKTFGRQQKVATYSRDYLAAICKAATVREQGAIFAAVDASGIIHAAGFLVWDQQRAYYLVSGAALSFGIAGPALYWPGI